MNREGTAEVLEEIALLLELKGENPFKIRAYRTGAEVVRGYAGDIMGRAVEGDLKGIKGIGDALAQKINELATTGKLEFYENLKGEFPPGVFDLFDLQGLGPKKVKALYEKLGVASTGQLKAVCESGQVAELAGFGKKTAEKILESIAYREQNAGRYRQNEVAGFVELVSAFLQGLPEVGQVGVAGSWRRGKETLHDLDFIVTTTEPEVVMGAFVGAEFVEGVIAKGATKSSVRLATGVQCDLRAVSAAEFPFALQYFTGSKEHNVALRGRAQKMGYTLNEYRLAAAKDGVEEAGGIVDEAGVYRALGLEWIEPALRENTGEIEAAEEGGLPKLLEIENLRGTFH
ncbi:MAG: helix-hairpin-helix domain-containing protein, partial [Verrucomicrobiales bacterium]|nr:helix-hairpin-helix domain-containing protein [Verrucomicrobiales bacterium]